MRAATRNARTVALLRAPVLALLGLVTALPVGAAQSPEPLRILGFRRELRDGVIELVLACSGPIAFHYSSPDPETIRLLLPGVDPAGVTPPHEAWGADLAEVALSAATGDEAPGALLELEFPAFRPYSIRAERDELRIELTDVPDAPESAAGPTPEEPAQPREREPPAPQLDPLAAPGPGEPEPGIRPDPDPTPSATMTRRWRSDDGETVTEFIPEQPPRVDPDPMQNPQPLPPEFGPPVEEPPAPAEPTAAAGPEAPLDTRLAVTEPSAPAAAGPPPASELDARDPLASAVAGPLDAGPPPEPMEPDLPLATRIFEVHREDIDGTLALRVPANGRPAYQAFFTHEGPERLVLDFDGTESRPLFQTLEVGVGPVRRVRVGQHQAEPVPIVRLVIDLDERVSHRIEADATGLTIRFDGLTSER